jgi:drug/metabolite transporter (DMT)-like permease
MTQSGGAGPAEGTRIGERQRRAYAYALASVLLWSTVASAFKLGLRRLEPDALLLWSSLASTIVLGLALLRSGSFARLRETTPGAAGRSALLGFLNPFLYYVVLFRAYDRLPGQMAQPLNYTWALAIALLSAPLLKQKIRPLSFLAILVSLFGVLLISTRGDLRSLRVEEPLGVGLAVGSSLIWAFFWIFNLRDHRDERVKLFLNFAFGTLFTFAFCLVTGRLVLPTPAGFLAAGYVGCFEMGLTFLLWLQALRLSRTTAAVSNLIFLSPFVSLFLLRFVVGEALAPSCFLGLTCIVAGIVLQQKTLGGGRAS